MSVCHLQLLAVVRCLSALLVLVIHLLSGPRGLQCEDSTQCNCGCRDEIMPSVSTTTASGYGPQIAAGFL